MAHVQIVPVGKVEPALLDYLALALPDGVGGECSVAGRPVDPREAFDPRRRQYHSTRILSQLAALPSSPGTRTLGVADVDLFIPILTYVFGEAQLGGTAAVISASRLRQEFYGLPGDEVLFYDRCAKEGLHEIGHTLGLVHCPSYDCVMHYSNSIEDVDLKRASWCRECAARQAP
ncbi:MAG TPA: archaemetzincin family Zn-dependent metalloprotease [Thermoanaerobaculia bacterium]|jgi:archaemetzincin|nr:archaemetzincin family Zn-dependent metalloprotease [Thermoanaerobaculia bacterium]